MFGDMHLTHHGFHKQKAGQLGEGGHCTGKVTDRQSHGYSEMDSEPQRVRWRLGCRDPGPPQAHEQKGNPAELSPLPLPRQPPDAN